MEHGLRRYEAAQRLMWFVFFIVCLVIAYPVSKLLKGGHPKPASSLLSFPPDALKSASFWTQLQWMQLEPFGSVAAYLVCVAILFLAGRFAWLIVQFVGKHLVMGLLTESIGQVSGRPAAHLDGSKVNLERLFPSQLLLVRMDRIPLQRVFHACQRLRLMLSNPDRPLSSEGLIEKERRIVETDWQILWSSWTPFRWLVWSLPVVALVQSGWLLFQRLQPALSGQRELLDVLGPMVGSLLPLVQTVVISVFLGLISGLVRRIENFYLSNIDSLFYDKLLSRLPFQSSDTLILLEVMQRQFQELHAALKRVEASVAISRSSVGRR
jgi:hypothetical protein